MNSAKKHWTPSADQGKALTMMMKQSAVALFADPGKGKTSICLAAFKILKEKGLVNKALVIAPLFPAYNSWPGEINKWEEFSGLTYSILHNKKGETKEQALERDVDIYIINYEGLLWLFPDLSAKALPKDRHTRHLRWDWDVLIPDEGTALKDTSTKRFRRLRSHFGTFRRRWLLTGTPIPNGYADLFGQIFVLDGGAALGAWITHFRNKYMIKSFNGFSYDLRPGAEDEIEEKIAPYVCRLKAPHKDRIVHRYTDVYLPEELMAQYRELENEFYLALEGGEIVASNAGVVGSKLRQFANGAVYATNECDERYWIQVHDYKLDALASIMAELNGEPILVFYEFQSDKERLLKRWPNTPFLGGGVSGEQSVKIIDDFNAGKIPMLLTHPKSAAHGLNLQERAFHVVWFGVTWNLEWFDQGNARLAREGQKAPNVFVYFIRCIMTKDEQVTERLKEKDCTQQKMLSALAKE
jgi:SNF2 family DNA or RNA helicase